MDIEGEIGRLQADRDAEHKAEVQRHRMAEEAWAAAREAFGAFRQALMDHGVAPVHVVRIDYGYVRGRQGFLRWIPERHTYKAEATELSGWLFCGMLILTDGRIMIDPSSYDPVRPEKRWERGRIASVHLPRGLENLDRTQATYREKVAAAERALEAAGLGRKITGSHLYIPADRNLDEVTCVPEASVRVGTAGTVAFRLAAEELVLHADGHLEMRPDRYETRTYPLERFFAEYIEAVKARPKEWA